MTLNVTDVTLRAMVRAYAETNQNALIDAVTAMKQGEGDMSNAIAEMLQPLAAELARMAGADEGKALAYLIEFVTENALGEPAEEPAAEETPMPEPTMNATLSANMDAVIEQAIQKALQARLGQQPDGALLTPKQKSINVQPQPEREKPLTLVRWVKAITDRRHDVLEKHHPRIKNAFRAMGINPDTSGGYLVPVEYTNQIIELLRSGAPVLALCRQLPMNRETLMVPKLATGATAYWIGENAQITESTPAIGQIQLVAKKLAARVIVSNELMEDSDPSVEAILMEDIARALAEKTDNAILEGAGVAAEPRGLANIADVTKTALNAAPTAANIIDMISRVEVANVNANPAWQFVFHPREKATLAKLADTTSGDFLWTEMGLPGHTMVGGYPATLRGYPYVSTTQVTIDTDNNNETKVYFGQWDDVVVGMRKTIELRASDEAGTSFEYDQTWLRAIMRLDLNIRHDESIEILTDVRTS